MGYPGLGTGEENTSKIRLGSQSPSNFPNPQSLIQEFIS